MPLTEDRHTNRLAEDGRVQVHPVAAGARIYRGAITVLNAAGYAGPGITGTGLTAVGRCDRFIDNINGLDGDQDVTISRGVFLFDNDPADPIDRSHIGDDCWIVDDQTVAATSGGDTRSIAGRVIQVNDSGIWVKVGL